MKSDCRTGAGGDKRGGSRRTGQGMGTWRSGLLYLTSYRVWSHVVPTKTGTLPGETGRQTRQHSRGPAWRRRHDLADGMGVVLTRRKRGAPGGRQSRLSGTASLRKIDGVDAREFASPKKTFFW